MKITPLITRKAMWSLMAACLTLTTPIATQAADEKPFFLKDGDRVAMFGDTFTQKTAYADYVELWTRTRFPNWKIVFYNCSRPVDMGHRFPGWFQRDIGTFKPSVLTVCMGFDDGAGGEPTEAKTRSYKSILTSLGTQARELGIERIAWLTLPPLEMRKDGPALQGNENVKKNAEALQEIASADSGLSVDIFTPYLELLDKVRATDLKNRLGGIPLSSGPNRDYYEGVLRRTWGDVPVLPGTAGSVLIASTILKELAFPSLVSAAEIDATGLKVVAQEQCQISDLKIGSAGGIQFQRKDAALPFFPQDLEAGSAQGEGVASDILKWKPLLEELNDYRLKVTGLKPGHYEIRLNGQKVDEQTAAALSQGVNLASAVLKKGPIADQLKQITELAAQKNKSFYEKLFHPILQLSVTFPDFLEGREELIAKIEQEREAAVKEQMEQQAKLEDAISKALIISPLTVDIVPLDGKAASNP